MPACPKTESCALQQNIGMREALRVWQSFYCEGAFSRCERFKLASAGVEVPHRLLPNGRLLDPPDELATVHAHGGRAA
jgi:hypothetical protein